MENRNQQLTKRERRESRQQEKEQMRVRLQRNRFLKRVMLWSFAALLVGGAVFGLVQLANTPSSGPAVLSDVVSVSDQVKGNREAKVVLVEYSDFQCPACASYHPLSKQLSKEFESDIAFVYRHFPLRQIHQNAQLAGQAAEAAGRQGQFWEMHDMIFENQRAWSSQRRGRAEETFVGYAAKLNLDIERFKKDIYSKEVEDKVNNDYQSGVRAGVSATPTFFLNGEKIQNPRSYDEFRNIINQTLAATP